jgi:hypothetical protein
MIPVFFSWCPWFLLIFSYLIRPVLYWNVREAQRTQKNMQKITNTDHIHHIELAITPTALFVSSTIPKLKDEEWMLAGKGGNVHEL